MLSFHKKLKNEKGATKLEYAIVLMVFALMIAPVFEKVVFEARKPFALVGGSTGTRGQCTVVSNEGDFVKMNCGGVTVYADPDPS